MIRFSFLFFTFLPLLILCDAQASLRIGEFPDESYILSDEKYPEVGSLHIIEKGFTERFTCDNVPPSGTGTLFTIEDMPEDLERRFVITAAHVVEDVVQNEGGKIHDSVYFNLGGMGSYKVGKIFIHPEYDAEVDKNDIALLLLKDTVCEVSPASLDFKIQKEGLRGVPLFSVGFGMTGNYLSRYRILDSQKRGSYSYMYEAPFENYSECEDLENVKRFCTSPLTKAFVLKAEDFSLVCDDLPLGVSRSGDSGGPIYDKEKQKVVGIISNGGSEQVDVSVIWSEKDFGLLGPYLLEKFKKQYEEAMKDSDNTLGSFAKEKEAFEQHLLISTEKDLSSSDFHRVTVSIDDILSSASAMLVDSREKKDTSPKDLETYAPLYLGTTNMLVSSYGGWIKGCVLGGTDGVPLGN